MHCAQSIRNCTRRTRNPGRIIGNCAQSTRNDVTARPLPWRYRREILPLPPRLPLAMSATDCQVEHCPLTLPLLLVMQRAGGMWGPSEGPRHCGVPGVAGGHQEHKGQSSMGSGSGGGTSRTPSCRGSHGRLPPLGCARDDVGSVSGWKRGAPEGQGQESRAEHALPGGAVGLVLHGVCGWCAGGALEAAPEREGGRRPTFRPLPRTPVPFPHSRLQRLLSGAQS